MRLLVLPLVALLLCVRCEPASDFTLADGAVVLWEQSVVRPSTQMVGVSDVLMKGNDVRVMWHFYDGGYIGEHPDGSSSTGFMMSHGIVVSMDGGLNWSKRYATFPGAPMYFVWSPSSLYLVSQHTTSGAGGLGYTHWELSQVDPGTYSQVGNSYLTGLPTEKRWMTHEPVRPTPYYVASFGEDQDLDPTKRAYLFLDFLNGKVGMGKAKMEQMHCPVAGYFSTDGDSWTGYCHYVVQEPPYDLAGLCQKTFARDFSSVSILVAKPELLPDSPDSGDTANSTVGPVWITRFAHPNVAVRLVGNDSVQTWTLPGTVAPGERGNAPNKLSYLLHILEGGYAELKEDGTVDLLTFAPSPCTSHDSCDAEIDYLHRLDSDEFLVFYRVNHEASGTIQQLVMSRQVAKRETVAP